MPLKIGSYSAVTTTAIQTMQKLGSLSSVRNISVDGPASNYFEPIEKGHERINLESKKLTPFQYQSLIKRLSVDGSKFILKSEGQVAQFDKKKLLILLSMPEAHYPI